MKYFCCCCKSKEKEPEIIKEKIDGPKILGRSCTDVFCAIIYLFFFCISIFFLLYGFTRGDLDKMDQPYDSSSNKCGKGEFKDFPYLFFNDYITNPALVTGMACVKKCPEDSVIGVECHPSSSITKCTDLKPYATVKLINRFCVVDYSDDKIDNTHVNAISNGKESKDQVKANAKA